MVKLTFQLRTTLFTGYSRSVYSMTANVHTALRPPKSITDALVIPGAIVHSDRSGINGFSEAACQELVRFCHLSSLAYEPDGLTVWPQFRTPPSALHLVKPRLSLYNNRARSFAPP